MSREIMSKGYQKLKSEHTIYNSAFPEQKR